MLAFLPLRSDGIMLNPFLQTFTESLLSVYKDESEPFLPRKAHVVVGVRRQNHRSSVAVLSPTVEDDTGYAQGI